LEKFLRDLLTPVEFKEIIKRWQVVKELSKKMHQWEISQKLKVGRATITRGARVLYNKNSAFKKILEKK
jgi:TrpR family trp operon transcriptional repressor